MKFKLTLDNACKNGLFIASILLIYFSLVDFTNQNNSIGAQTANEKGYELQELGEGAYVISAGGYNSIFLVTGNGVIVADAPPSISDKIMTQ